MSYQHTYMYSTLNLNMFSLFWQISMCNTCFKCDIWYLRSRELAKYEFVYFSWNSMLCIVCRVNIKFSCALRSSKRIWIRLAHRWHCEPYEKERSKYRIQSTVYNPKLVLFYIFRVHFIVQYVCIPVINLYMYLIHSLYKFSPLRTW